MNKFQKASLAILIASGMAFAAGSLWKVGAPYGIAQFDWIKNCLAGPDFDETDPNDPCYKEHGGWWFGYVAGPASGDVAAPACDEYRGEAMKSKPDGNYVKAKISNSWVSFVGPDYDNCEGPPFTDKEAGGTWLIEGGLELELNIGPGIDATYSPAIAAIGLNFSQPPITGKSPPINRNFQDKGGFCLTYTLSGLDSDDQNDFALELGWNEDDASQASDADKIPYDTYYAPINNPKNNNVLKQDFSWDDFNADGWSSGAGGPWPKLTALTQMRSIKIRLKRNATPYLPLGPVSFKLIELGWLGECSTTPIAPPGATVVNATFKQEGRRIFSLVSSVAVKKPIVVQVINMQGAVVHSQTMSPNNTMNLSSLPIGVYMLRAPALNHTSKIILK
jgi:hypothetical protein